MNQKPEDPAAAYDLVRRTLVRFDPHLLGRADLGCGRAYIGKVCGFSATQTMRLIRRHAETGAVSWRGACAHGVRMPTMRKVLVADDDAHIRDVLAFALRRGGFQPVEAADGGGALDAFHAEGPELVLLDVLMPELDGIEVCRAIRRESNVPILFLSSKGEEADLIEGLEAGADDYISKPFSPRELVARVRAAFRRVDARLEGDHIRIGALDIDAAARRATVHGCAVALTRTEFGLLTTLARHVGQVIPRSALMRHAYDGRRIVSDRTIDSHIRRLREKLKAGGADPIRTVHGVGYRLAFD